MSSSPGRLFRAPGLAGQLLITLALALLVAQVINAALIYRAQRDEALDRMAVAATIRLARGYDRLERGLPLQGRNARREDRQRRFGSGGEGAGRDGRPDRPEIDSRRDRHDGADEPFRQAEERRRGERRIWMAERSPVDGTMQSMPGLEEHIAEILIRHDFAYKDLQVGLIRIPEDELARIKQERNRLRDDRPIQDRYRAMVALQLEDGRWMVTRIFLPSRDYGISGYLILQTLVIYLILLLPAMWLMRRASRSLKALRTGVAKFEASGEASPVPERGPPDIAGLIGAFNQMSARISAMLNEKDVMLGAIGHDLKTPLAALRVRVESVSDERKREAMIASIRDLDRTLDDILSLARIGRASTPAETVNVTAMLETLSDDYRDRDHDVSLAEGERVVAGLYLVWAQRALRNLIDNALRYGARARISLMREGRKIVFLIEDDGPGIDESQMKRLLEPFERLEHSRQRSTGGTGLGLTIANAIAVRHGGSLSLHNRREGQDGAITGLVARLELADLATGDGNS